MGVGVCSVVFGRRLLFGLEHVGLVSSGLFRLEYLNGKLGEGVLFQIFIGNSRFQDFQPEMNRIDNYVNNQKRSKPALANEINNINPSHQKLEKGYLRARLINKVLLIMGLSWSQLLVHVRPGGQPNFLECKKQINLTSGMTNFPPCSGTILYRVQHLSEHVIC